MQGTSIQHGRRNSRNRYLWAYRGRIVPCWELYRAGMSSSFLESKAYKDPQQTAKCHANYNLCHCYKKIPTRVGLRSLGNEFFQAQMLQCGGKGSAKPWHDILQTLHTKGIKVSQIAQAKQGNRQRQLKQAEKWRKFTRRNFSEIM